MMRGMSAQSVLVERVDARRADANMMLGHGRLLGSPLKVTFTGGIEAMEAARAELIAHPDEALVALVEPHAIMGWN